MYDYFLGDRITEGAGGKRALVTDSEEFTYREVHERAGRFADVLRAAGVVPGDRVLMAMPDGVDYVAAFFGIVRMGGVVVMVNPHLGEDQVGYFFEYTTPKAALIHESVVPSFSSAAARSGNDPAVLGVGTEAFEERLRDADPAAPVHRGSPDDAAVFLFSGGTTGNPKAVVQTHRAFVNTTELYGKGTLGMTADDITLSVPKLFFGYATGTNLLFPFAVGATSVVWPGRCTSDALFERIAKHRPTVLINVPTMVNNLVNDDSAAQRDCSSLRLATSAGEALPAELHRRWDEAFGVPLLDGLGTAEMWHIFISNRPDDVRPGTLGRVVDGFEVRACDNEGAEVRPGEVGLMRVRGDSLALGYWQDEAKSRSAFQNGWFVSGDMVSIGDDGYVTYCGRSDDMLKVSGKWLSPKELENCLLEHEAVRDVAVVGVRTHDGLVKPSAFVIPTEGVEGSDALVAELQAWVKSRLEPYKYPRSVRFLEDFPRTHLGKVDRGALARPG